MVMTEKDMVTLHPAYSHLGPRVLTHQGPPPNLICVDCCFAFEMWNRVFVFSPTPFLPGHLAFLLLLTPSGPGMWDWGLRKNLI